MASVHSKNVENKTADNRHVVSLNEPSFTIRCTWGDTATITSNEFPVLKGLSIQRLVLQPYAVREPHWHVNANKLTYCLCGSALVTIVGNQGERDTFAVSEGQVFFVPSGYLHHIENLNGMSNTEFIIAFSHELPEAFSFSSAFSAMTDAVLGNTFQLPGSVSKDVSKHLCPNKYKFDLEKMSPPFIIHEGSIKMASKTYWPILENISMFSLRILTRGMCEPHWHPETTEMGYIVDGDASITILSPNADHRLDTFQLKADDVYFIPRAYPHKIANIGNGELKILVFYGQSIPGHIGYKDCFYSHPQAVAASVEDAIIHP